MVAATTSRFLHGDVGTGQNACNGGPEDGVQFRGPSSTGQWNDLIPPTNMVIDDVTIHDTTGFVGCGSHTDGLQSFGCKQLHGQEQPLHEQRHDDIIIYQITGAAPTSRTSWSRTARSEHEEPGPRRLDRRQACLADHPNERDRAEQHLL